MVVYKIENLINGKKYIGQTIKTFDERYQFKGEGVERVLAYLEMRERNKQSYSETLYGNDHLLKSIRKYGVDNFTVEIIDEAETQEELNEKEIEWIAYYKSDTDGYNKCIGGLSNSGWKPSDETRKIWSEARKGKMVGVNNPNYGQKHSQEVRNRMSKARRGKLTGAKHPKAKAIINLDTLEIFETITDACDKYNLSNGNIVNVVQRKKRGNHGTRKTAGGFRWMYHDEYLEKGDIVGETKNNHFKSIINLDTGEIFETIKQASDQYKIDASQLSKVCRGKAKTAGGCKWKYHKE